jgi:hypothetical protein
VSGEALALPPDNACGETLSLRLPRSFGSIAAGYDEIVHVCMNDRHSHGHHRSGDGTEWRSIDPRGEA